MKIQNLNDKVIVGLEENLDANTSEQATRDIMDILKRGISLEIDMKNCAYVSSAGLRALLKVAKEVKNQYGTVKLNNICKEVSEIMVMTGFDNLFSKWGENHD